MVERLVKQTGSGDQRYAAGKTKKCKRKTTIKAAGGAKPNPTWMPDR